MTAVVRLIQHQISNSDVLEQQQWLREDTSDSSQDTITSRFERQVTALPDKQAIVTDEISLTYRALDLKASRIAAVLASLPSQHDRPIGLFIKDEAARIAAMLGGFKANRVVIPLAPDSPEKWLTQVIEDSGTAQIIVDSSTRSIAELAATGNVAVLEVEQLDRSLEPFVAGRTASPNDTAYIVYTSGSTGRPKGVAITHRSMIPRADVRHSLYGLGRSDRFANLRSSGVASGIANTLLPLFAGGCLFSFDLHRHGLQKLPSWLISQKITYISFSVSLLRTWLASLPDNLRFPALRCVEATSERLYTQDVIHVSRHLEGDWRIGHNYASTESGVIAAQVFTSSRPPDAGMVATGHPVDGMEVSINDEAGALVPQGEIGEIVVRSRFLAQGYWNNPDLTAKVFQTDPIESAIRVYRTGDLGRFRSDGVLEHLGRKGRTIRLRGYNVEPFQVECELLCQPGITDAAVMLHESAAGEEPCLVGYVVAPPNASTSGIRKRLAERLPSYMVPSYIVVLDSFPISSSGKIDCNRLPPPNWEQARLVTSRSPRDERERELLAIWQEVLNIANIGIDDDFFELGGSSLQALTVFLEIEARLDCSLSPTTMLQAPTIAGLAEFIRTIKGAEGSQLLVPLRTSGTGLPLFLVAPRFALGMDYRHLIGDLKSDRPIFGLQPPPLDGKHRVPRTIKSIAADYVSEVRRVEPHGPYFIAGVSFGAWVSFEIAQQLVRRGERVNFLGLIDPILHDGWASRAARLSRRVWGCRSLQELFHELKNFRPRYRMRNTLLDLGIRLGGSIPYKRRNDYHEWLKIRTTRNYGHEPYLGHIKVFSSAGNSERQTAFWGPLALGGLTVLEIPAPHNDIVSPPHSKVLAEYLDSCLDAVDGRVRR